MKIVIPTYEIHEHNCDCEKCKTPTLKKWLIEKQIQETDRMFEVLDNIKKKINE